MLFLRIKQAEVALADGRLDEAFALVQQDQRLRDHRHGQALVTRLVSALVERGRAHLAAERYPQAMEDGDKAGRLGGNLPAVAELRSAAGAGLLDRQREERHANRALAAARRHVENGQFSAGERLLAGLAGQQSQAAVLMEDVAAQRETFASALAAAEAALARGDVEAAAADAARAGGSRAASAPAEPRLAAVVAEISQQLRRRVTGAIEQGRLDLAESLARPLGQLGERHTETEQLKRAVAQYRLAWELVDAGRLRQAEEVLRRLTSLFPRADWIEDSLRQLRQAYEGIDALRAGPLGLFALGAGAETVSHRPAQPSPKPQPAGASPPPLPPAAYMRAAGPIGTPPAVPGSLPSRFIVRVDGVGSFLVLRSPRVTIGPVSSSRAPDVGLVADPGLPVAMIERMDDDYFIRAPAQLVAVNDRSAVGDAGRLLATGDRVALSPRCRLAFHLPSPASTSAVLDLTGSRLPMADVRRVILMDRDLIIGPHSGAHVRTDPAAEREGIVLHLRGGRLCCESKAEVSADGRPVDRHVGIPLGAHVRSGGLSFVITEV